MDVRTYYRGLYGEPDREARFVTKSGQTVFVYKWDAALNPEGVAIYATDGARLMQRTENRGYEFFIGLTPEADGVAEAIAEAALHGNGTSFPPTSGDTITLSYTLWPSTAASTFLFEDGSEIIPPLTDEVSAVHFMQLVPLFPAELDFKKNFGVEALWDLFCREQIEFWNSQRISMPWYV